MGEAMTADLASLCLYATPRSSRCLLTRGSHLKDYSVAASHFRELASCYGDKEWLKLGTTMLDMWAECLQEMGNVKEHITVALRAVASASIHSSSLLTSMWSFNNLIRVSESMNEQVIVPLDQHFVDISLDRHIRHHDGYDGFELDVNFRSLFGQDFSAKSCHVRLIGLGEDKSTELWLSTKKSVRIRPGLNRVIVTSNVCSEPF